MIDDFAILISSCDNYSDLWHWHVELLKRNWVGGFPKVYLVTDKETKESFENISVLHFEGDMPARIKKAIEQIPCKYILITLDDYYVIDAAHEEQIASDIDYMSNNRVDYLSLYNRRYAKGYGYRKQKGMKQIDVTKTYAVNFYPAIWNRDFILFCIDGDLSPWDLEPKLSAKAVCYDAKCEEDLTGCFIILDVIRKGKILRKANKYFLRNNISIGDRELTKKSYEMKLDIMDFVKFHTPHWFYILTKKIAKFFGAHFYSE